MCFFICVKTACYGHTNSSWHYRSKFWPDLHFTYRRWYRYTDSLKYFSTFALAGAEKLFEKVETKFKKAQKTKDIETDVHFFNSKAGMRFLADRAVASGKDIYYIGAVEVIYDILGKEEFYRRVTLKRLKTETKLFMITNKDVFEDSIHKDRLGNFRNYRILPERLRKKSAKFFFGNTVAIGSKSKTGTNVVVIDDYYMAKMERFLFDVMWDLLK